MNNARISANYDLTKRVLCQVFEESNDNVPEDEDTDEFLKVDGRST